MARTNDRNRYEYGICTNRNKEDGKPCSKCMEKTIQKVRIGRDLVCEECGAELRKVAPPPQGPNWKLILPIVAVALIAVVGVVFSMGGEESNEVITLTLDAEQKDKNVGDVDKLSVTINPVDAETEYSWESTNEAVAVVNDGQVSCLAEGVATIIVSSVANPEVKDSCVYTIVAQEPPGELPEGEKPEPNNAPFSWAKYEGPMRDDKPHGFGGTLIVTKNYSIDLKDAQGTTLKVVVGDKIVSAKCSNGKLLQGELHRSNGERRTFVIGR